MYTPVPNNCRMWPFSLSSWCPQDPGNLLLLPRLFQGLLATLPTSSLDPSHTIYFQNKSYKIMDLLKHCYNVPLLLEKDFSIRPYMMFWGSSRILISYYITPPQFRHTSILKAQRYSRHVPSSGSWHYVQYLLQWSLPYVLTWKYHPCLLSLSTLCLLNFSPCT